MPRPYDLSSVTALICFEAAARNGSFKKAARELNVTPAAVSHQIKALENDLKCDLFLRRSRGVDLTEKGAFLFVALQRGFEAISEAVTQIRDRPETVDVTIRTTTAVSSLWLTPKISAFWKSHPSVTVAQIVSDVPGAATRCDLSIQYGIPQEDGDECRELFRDQIVALGTPRFASEHDISSVEDLLKVPLIHMNNEETDWTNWNDWFQALGQGNPKGRRFSVNNYMIALQAAQDDVGAVLGWDGLVESLMRERRLVKLVPDAMPSPMAFYLKIRPKAGAKVRLFAKWLAESS
ncbi:MULTISPECIES: LysR family transcriptional regulator [unclassified Mesorhizobium]|uniref:LysR family transcriptional regulator n=1 Tax=unclassified Mesorhizobium TaxID=325217 RepID=UPI000BB094EA|nr:MULTISPECIES: LysR family transcriptional regulator [unclassified Mesorhizobium]AZO12033.1 LysR family transcriptional regulator [Mesorhizobium sp. M3A.F.Ca.ET.080.04.2.1]PBB84322.1 LysR family transcriptional regulator [Mesorhizobium sp. WSM3876]RWB74749.1 MAG: LysR family transcriptional regulator [Mesorhizobium sp.]RWB89792.1 MAG: LysR family transcriptional regulator [Mesorhizobium sp.]RWE26155.1 MAG: LysR family transcriptional regulator [Mesorhizobium sp.]